MDIIDYLVGCFGSAQSPQAAPIYGWLWIGGMMCVMLAACAPGATQTPLTFEQQAVAATQQAIERQADLQAGAVMATQQALETQRAAKDASAMLQVTQQAFDLMAKQTAQSQDALLGELQITAQYLDNKQQAQDALITQMAGFATATAIAAESNERVSEQRRNEVLATLWPILLCVGGFTIIGVLAYGGYVLIRAKTDRIRYVETSLGPVFVLATGGLMNPMQQIADVMSDEIIDVKPDPQPQSWASRGGVLSFSNKAANDYGTDDYGLVMAFMRQAVRKNPLAVQIPSREKMGWTSNPWQKAKGILEAADLVYAEDREGTYINQERYPNVGALYAALHMGKVNLGI